MTLTHIAIFVIAAVCARLSLGVRDRGGRNRLDERSWFILVASLIALYWLQPSTPIRNLDFWLPTATIALTALTWAVTCRFAAGAPPAPEPRAEAGAAGAVIERVGLDRDTLVTSGLVMASILLIALTRYVEPLCCLTPSRPPDIWLVGPPLAVIAIGIGLIAQYASSRVRLATVYAVVLLGLLVILKTEPLALGLSALLRQSAGQNPALATALDVQWLGFSYVAFRLVHTLRDRASGRLPALSLREYVAYVLFFPAITAGPIDRAERFVKDFRDPPASADLIDGGRRVLIGVFKKFVVADGLALLALNPANAGQTQAAGWTWVLVYAYTFRIFLDFSGYTDVAIGLGRLLGIKLPENFERPYLKPNLTQFWNSWHITLAQWFRAYYFNPLTRWLRTRGVAPAVIIFITQLTTMALIGLWHGVSWNFVAWGAWHGVGLFIHNRWLDFARPRFAGLEQRPGLKRAVELGGLVLTFHYVALGWVWFALPSLDVSLRVFGKLVGM